MISIRDQLIALDHAKQLSQKNVQKLLKLHQTYFPRNSLHSLLTKLNLTQKQLTEIEKDYDSYLQNPLHPSYEIAGIYISTIIDANYPQTLKEIYDPPNLLYLKGDSSLLDNRKCIAVVGSRTPSEYGIQVLQYLLPPLIEAGYCVVSGLARGIDSAAHRISMQAGGRTIAVLGNGLHRTYPAENKGLAEEIARQHLLLSEYTPHTAPQKWHFPARNRIISGLCSGTLVIEGKARSGSLITAYCALEQGREVFAVPGQIQDENSNGPHLLIKEGAKLVTHPDDILEEINNYL